MKIVVQIADVRPIYQLKIELALPLITVDEVSGYNFATIVRKTMKEY